MNIKNLLYNVTKIFFERSQYSVSVHRLKSQHGAATFTWCEDNGTQTGSPVHGTTRTGFGGSGSATDMNWKNHDDCTNGAGGTSYTANPIVAGNDSFIKYQYGEFTGTFNQILNGLWSLHTAGSLGTGLTLVGTVSSTYATPVTSGLGGSPTNFTSVVAIGSGLGVNFSTTGPEASSPSSTLSAAGYTQYLISQLQTSGSAAAGDTATVTATLQYNEN